MKSDLIIWQDRYTEAELLDLADVLEGLNTPGNRGTPIRRITDMVWALVNDSAVCIVTAEG